jgi:predicted transcriptional regulator
VKETLAHHIGLEDERHRQTLEALAEVDSGRTVEHTDVEAWAARLGISKSKRRRG